MIYFDNAATTGVLPEVAELMIKYLTVQYGNPSSLHRMGLEAERALKSSRGLLGKHLGCSPDRIIFNSGATEGNNTVINSVVMSKLRTKQSQIAQQSKIHIITSAIEHPSVLEPIKALQGRYESIETTFIKPNGQGMIRASDVLDALRPHTVLVTIMHVNNEIGTIQPIEEIGRGLKQGGYKGIFHVDGTQAMGKIKLKLADLPVDYYTLSAHKCHGPKGVGLLYKGTNSILEPLLYGGGQEGGHRPGTHNVASIIGMAKAISLSDSGLSQKIAHVQSLADQLYKGLEGLRTYPNNPIFIANQSQKVPHIISLGFSGMKSEVLLHTLEQQGIYVSSGSACSSNKRETLSHVIAALDLPKAYRDGVIRISLSATNTQEEIGALLLAIQRVVSI